MLSWLNVGASQHLFAQARQEGTGPGQRYLAVRNLQPDLLVYDEAFSVYVPHIPELHGSELAFSTPIDLESNRYYTLLIRSKQPGFLFFDAALRQRTEAGAWQVLPVDSLFRVYRKPQVFLTLYGPAGANNWEIVLAHRRPLVARPATLTEDLLSVRPRVFDAFANFFGIGLLLLLAMHALLYTLFRRAFQLYYNPAILLNLANAEDSFVISRPLGRMSLAFMVNLSLLMAFLFLYTQQTQANLFGVGAFLPLRQTVGGLLLNYGILSSVVFGLFLGKYLLIALVGSLYKFDALVNIHYFKVLHTSLLFASGLVVVVAGVYSRYAAPSGTYPNYVFIVFVGFYVARAVWLYLTLARLLPVKNLYLFSYLCLVELIPLVVGIRLAN